VSDRTAPAEVTSVIASAPDGQTGRRPGEERAGHVHRHAGPEGTRRRRLARAHRGPLHRRRPGLLAPAGRRQHQLGRRLEGVRQRRPGDDRRDRVLPAAGLRRGAVRADEPRQPRERRPREPAALL